MATSHRLRRFAALFVLSGLAILAAEPATAQFLTPASLVPAPMAPSYAKNAAILGTNVSWLQRMTTQQQGGQIITSEASAASLQTAVVRVGAPAQIEPRLRPVAQASYATANTSSSTVEFTDMAASDRPDIFGSVALAVSHTPLDAKWRHASISGFGEKGAWTTLVAATRTLSAAEQVAEVNAWVNARITFADDGKEYGENDHWSNGAMTIRRGRGDCEDYALAKMQLLRAIGFPERDMYLSIVKDLVRRADHAVLIVRLDGRLLVLDNNTNRLTNASANQDYRPVFTYNATGTWTHGYRRESYAARSTGDMGPIIARH